MAPASLDEQLAAIVARIGVIAQADARQLDDLKIELLGRKAGALTAVLRALPTLPPEERSTRLARSPWKTSVAG